MPQRTDLEFNPAFGSPLLLRPEGFEGELKTYFIGMEPSKYVICSLGNALADKAALSALRDKTRRTRLFYLRQGVMCGFTVRIQGFKTSPFGHLYLSFPKIAQTFNLRQHDRIDCHLPAMISAPAGSSQGMISNISKGGCRMSLLPGESPLSWLCEGECYDLAMQLPTLSEPQHCFCRLSQRIDGTRDANLLQLGLQFQNFDTAHEECIEAFIRHVSDYRI